MFVFSIPGRPATKKNSQRIVKSGGRMFILPSKAFCEYQAHCKALLGDIIKESTQLPINYGISVQMTVFMDNKRIGDHCGYMQAMGDILQHIGVITDDKWITWITPEDSWIFIDKECPRVELVINRCKHISEDWK